MRIDKLFVVGDTMPVNVCILEPFDTLFLHKLKSFMAEANVLFTYLA